MSQSLPSFVKVGPYVFTIITDNSLSDDDQYGNVSLSQLRITICENASPQIQRETLQHELWHACAYVVGLDEDKKALPEEFISRVSPTYMAVMETNPHVRMYLYEETYGS